MKQEIINTTGGWFYGSHDLISSTSDIKISYITYKNKSHVEQSHN